MSDFKPGSDTVDVEAMIRVDHAGEYGATRIYAGQLAVLGNKGATAHEVARMAEQEKRHLERFNQLIAERGVRPTLLQPFWDVAGFTLGAATALMGPRAAMACTDAVETEIDKHYAEQLEQLGDADPELSADIARFREEELEHRDTAREHGSQDAMAYPLLTGVIRLGCRAAIAVAKRI
ncbi:demethoxyubiquinone hydroxylase family protein [Sphingomicrobium flavum]|uniref:demethoxyubiquinone hydroxylase family protein n=1 Tax=Sphingomicrobium flavum TaxID=1229164 RepID=UPI0021ADDD16|nr:demethoxyubiquinone hydroxylase family protein [Sphingomicrobium flavum]